MTFRELRERQRRTKPFIAELTGLDYTTINKIEQGKVPDPRYSTVVALSRAIGVKPDEVAEAIRQSAKRKAAA